MSNKLPLSWFKSSFVTGTVWAAENFQKRIVWDSDVGGKDLANDGIHHIDGSGRAQDNLNGMRSDDDDSDEDDDSGDNGDEGDGNIVQPIGQWVAGKNNFLGGRTPMLRNSKSGKKQLCPENTWNQRDVRDNRMEWIAFWMLNEYCDSANDTVEFR